MHKVKPQFNEIGIKDVKFGIEVNIIRPANLYGCEIDDQVFIGPFVEIQNDVYVGKRSRVQSHTFICSLVRIGNDCFIGHGVMFINDLFSDGGPAKGDKSKWRHTRIGDNVSIGSNSTILPISICNNVVIGAGSVVTKDIHNSGVYLGNPAKFVRNI